MAESKWVVRTDEEIKAAFEDAWHRRWYVRATMDDPVTVHPVFGKFDATSAIAKTEEEYPGIKEWRESVDDFEWGRVSGIQATLMWLSNEYLHEMNPDGDVYDQILNTQGHGDT